MKALLTGLASLASFAFPARQRRRFGAEISDSLIAQVADKRRRRGTIRAAWIALRGWLNILVAGLGERRRALARVTPSRSGSRRPRRAPGKGEEMEMELDNLLADVRHAGRRLPLGVPLLEGRTFRASDRGDSPPVMVLNRTAARELFGEESAVGHRLSIGIGLTSGDTMAEVIGVVGDVLYEHPSEGIMAEAYVSYRQEPDHYATVMARTRGEPMAVVPQARHCSPSSMPPRRSTRSRRSTISATRPSPTRGS